MILFFDTETTGLPSGKIPFNHPDQPAVLQLGAVLTDDDGLTIEEYATLIKIGDKPIHPMALAAHGISNEEANSKGVHPMEAFIKFHQLSQSAEFFVCHNFDFDFKLIKIMAHSLTQEHGDEPTLIFDEINEIPYKCTMKSTIQFCALPFPSGRKGCKFPKLEELHRILFNEEFSGAHDALADVLATKRCYFELVKRGVL